MNNKGNHINKKGDQMSDIGRSFQCLNKRQMTEYGKMNRANRLYFSITLFDQASALGIGSAELSAIEFGVAQLTSDIGVKTAEFWIQKFSDEQHKTKV